MTCLCVSYGYVDQSQYWEGYRHEWGGKAGRNVCLHCLGLCFDAYSHDVQLSWSYASQLYMPVSAVLTFSHPTVMHAKNRNADCPIRCLIFGAAF